MATLKELCRAVDGELIGDGDAVVAGVGSVEHAGPDEIAPVESARFLAAAAESKAAAFLVADGLEPPAGRPAIRAKHPLAALNRVIEVLGLATPAPAAGVHPTAVVDPTAEVPASATVGPYAVLGAGVRLGERCRLAAGVVIERGVTLGDDCFVEPHAVLHEGAVVGHRVRIGAHAAISRHGFGYAPGAKGIERLYHVGKVILEDDVHIGAGTMVDRGRFDATRIGKGSALDNLVHIGHNSRIGELTFVAAQTGLAGNAFIGSQCEVGGQAGFANRCGVGDRCRIAAKSGVIGKHGDDVELLWYPARERREVLRWLAALKRLADGTRKRG